MTPVRNAFQAVLGILALFVLAVAAPSFAQGLSGFGGGEGPLEINADQGIEWHRIEQVYIARGNARAARGEIELFADLLTAHYRDDADGNTEIYLIEAEGNVRIVSPTETVYGDSGAYRIDDRVVVLTGDDLRIISPNTVLRARDSLQYWEDTQVAVATGDAVVTKFPGTPEEERLRADLLRAYFQQGATGTELVRIDAEGNVEISTADEFVVGDTGSYYPPQSLATLTGDVKITRAGNQLNGGYAEVNLATGVSRLMGAPPGSTETTRVDALIIPQRNPREDETETQ